MHTFPMRSKFSRSRSLSLPFSWSCWYPHSGGETNRTPKVTRTTERVTVSIHFMICHEHRLMQTLPSPRPKKRRQRGSRPHINHPLATHFCRNKGCGQGFRDNRPRVKHEIRDHHNKDANLFVYIRHHLVLFKTDIVISVNADIPDADKF